MTESNLTLGSLFSGIGGFELAATWAGIEPIWNCEIDPFCQSILKQHFPKTIQYGDIREQFNPPYCDIITGGFPCQDISLAGKGEGISGNRSGLWNEMARVIRNVRPKFVIIENSPALLIRGFEKVLCDLSEIGYDAEWDTFFASDFGYPHERERLFCIAYSRSLNVQTICKGHRQISPLSHEASSYLRRYLSVEWLDGRTDYRPIARGNGVSNKMDTSKALGNAIIPLIAYYLLESIKFYHQNYSKNLQNQN